VVLNGQELLDEALVFCIEVEPNASKVSDTQVVLFKPLVQTADRNIHDLRRLHLDPSCIADDPKDFFPTDSLRVHVDGAKNVGQLPGQQKGHGERKGFRIPRMGDVLQLALEFVPFFSDCDQDRHAIFISD